MYLTTYDDPSAFSQLVTPLLEEREAENNLPLGIVSNARAHEVNNATESDLERPMLAVVHEAAIPGFGRHVLANIDTVEYDRSDEDTCLSPRRRATAS
ncbi:MAG: hypothetical protein ACLFNT_14890 [Spirochaetales bacterium]